MFFLSDDTIVAPATAPGTAAIAVIRLSGPRSIDIAGKFFHTRKLIKKDLHAVASNSVSFGAFASDGELVDEILVTVFRAPHSYTGEDTVEISCHGSPYIRQRILALLLLAGARMAGAGEFTLRAFMNGKLDLSQAEAVADLIESTSSVAHDAAMKQMRGGFSNRIAMMREELIRFASLVELELDFSEEDVEFADRSQLSRLVSGIIATLKGLIKSFELGNVLKDGIPVAIIGRPNAGKSTLLNALLEEERAIVSDIPGTTRDIIEDVVTIDGVPFRFIDTAGLRDATDEIERIGVDRAVKAATRAAAVIYLFDATVDSVEDVQAHIATIDAKNVIPVANKCDVVDETILRERFSRIGDVLFISAKSHQNLVALRRRLLEIYDGMKSGAADTIVTNARHAHALANAVEELQHVSAGLLQNVPGDLLALDIRAALAELGLITGQVTSDDLLQSIFTRFCIGK